MLLRHANLLTYISVYEARPTGDPEFDKKEAIRYLKQWAPIPNEAQTNSSSVKKELIRLERNKERRHAREKQKGMFRASFEGDIGSPSGSPAPTDKPTGTTRKCANCGQAGHIKTNKKYCDRHFKKLLPRLSKS